VRLNFYLIPHHDAANVRGKTKRCGGPKAPYAKQHRRGNVMFWKKTLGKHYRVKAYVKESGAAISFITDHHKPSPKIRCANDYPFAQAPYAGKRVMSAKLPPRAEIPICPPADKMSS